jgi:hypothetical protein
VVTNEISRHESQGSDKAKGSAMKAIKEIVRTLVIISVIWLLLFTSGYSAESKIQTGATGVSGINGTNGLDGTNGTNGRNGNDGLDGENFIWIIEGATQIIFRNVSCAKNQRIASLDATVENNTVAYLDLICENI